MRNGILFILCCLASVAYGQGTRPPPYYLSQLLDVTISSPTTGQLLTYDSALGKWKNAAGGVGVPGGSNTQLQYNNSGAFGGIPSLTYTSGSTLVALQAGAKFNLQDPIDTTKKVTLDLSGITTGTTRNIAFPNAAGTLMIGANNLSDVASASTARTNLGLAIGVNVQAWDADLDALGALTGTNTIYYRSGAATWSAVTIGANLTFSGGILSAAGGGGGTPGGSNTQLQFNNSSAFGGVTYLTYDGTTVSQQVNTGASRRYAMLDAADNTKKAEFDLSNIATATVRTINLPNANSTTIQSDTGASNNFLTAVSAQGLISKAQPAFSNL